jgi:hypothetical protein
MSFRLPAATAARQSNICVCLSVDAAPPQPESHDASACTTTTSPVPSAYIRLQNDDVARSSWKKADSVGSSTETGKSRTSSASKAPDPEYTRSLNGRTNGLHMG